MLLQLRALQAVSGYTEEDEAGGGSERGGGSGGAPAPGGGRAGLEAALAAKSRQLEHKQTMLRLELAEARGEGQQGGAGLIEHAVCMQGVLTWWHAAAAWTPGACRRRLL